MAQNVLLKRTATPAKIPLTTDLALGELGINTYDGKIFIKKNNGTDAIVEITDAANIKNTPAGNIAATTVQAAINELDTEKANLSQTVKNFGNVTVQAVVGSSVSCTTAQFVTWLTTLGAFSSNVSIMKGTWDYAGNNDISDTGFGALELAGCIIQTFTDGAQYIIRVTSPSTNSSGLAGGIHEYINHGAGFVPGWRRVYTSALNGNISGNATTATNLASIGTTFGGTYPMTINAAGVIYSHAGITFNGSTNDLTVTGNIYANGTYYYGDNKSIIQYSDTWLRLNPINDFTAGIYCNTGILRTDGNFQVGNAGASFNVTSTGSVAAAQSITAASLVAGSTATDNQSVSIRGYSNTPTSWKGGGAFGYSSATVIMGELAGLAQIGGHNANLSAWANLYINSSATGNVIIGKVTDSGAKFQVEGSAFVSTTITTPTVNATASIGLGSTQQASVVYNATSASIDFIIN